MQEVNAERSIEYGHWLSIVWGNCAKSRNGYKKLDKELWQFSVTRFCCDASALFSVYQFAYLKIKRILELACEFPLKTFVYPHFFHTWNRFSALKPKQRDFAFMTPNWNRMCLLNQCVLFSFKTWFMGISLGKWWTRNSFVECEWFWIADEVTTQNR